MQQYLLSSISDKADAHVREVGLDGDTGYDNYL